VYEWFHHFKRGEMSVEDQLHCEPPSTTRNDENVEKVHQAVLADCCCRTNHEISEIIDVFIYVCSCQPILMEDLIMKLGCCKIRDLQEELKDDPHFLTKVVICDESWCHGYDSESEQQSSQWKSPNSPRTKIAQQIRSSFKKILTSLFDVDGMVYREFVSPEHTVNQKYLLECIEKIAREPATKSSRNLAEWGLVLAT
jgi:hypothetical protein